MMVLMVERVSPSLRGDLGRWLIEVQAGVFVGRVSEVVREALWERATNRADDGTVTLLWRTSSEQGFDVRTWQPKQYVPINVDGIWLTLRPAADT
ncbi:type I-E CRISPR-associated endoribonuclease Cas2e [Rudanella lutea]|uniref:type I-E CRISPR-associated endoribonuclease Cas2e n=1 Tax=Rudanella lutea TaxID=451374 RepID=UPI00035E3F1D|nr:type I-E CRISPR-associated endoribonuclease Cas2e [Rudanella lutea]